MRRTVVLLTFFFLGFQIARGQSPGGVSGSISFWLMGDAGVTGASPITAWADQDGTPLAVWIYDNPTLTSSAINYNDVITFDATDDGGGIPDQVLANQKINATTTPDFTVIAVYRQGTQYDAGAVWGCQDAGGDDPYLIDYDTWSVNNSMSNGTAAITDINNLFRLKTPSLATFIGDEDAVNGSYIYVNGTQEQNFTLNFGPETTLDWFNIGNFDFNNGTTDGVFEGDVAEIICYTTNITNAQRHRIESYLCAKWGITMLSADDGGTGGIDERDYLASDGSTVFWDYSDNSTYHNGVTVIGRDDGSGLDQRQSRNEDGDSYTITMNKGGAFTSNRDFLAWGHDGGALTLTSTNKHPSYDRLLKRTWKADLTGAPGSVSISFDLSETGFISRTAGSYALVYDGTDADFSSGASTHTTGASFSGDVLTFTGMSFTDGDFFTLAGPAPTGGFPGGVEANIRLWVKATDEVYNDAGTTLCTDGQTVQEWHDQGASGEDLSQTTASEKPTYETGEINFNPGIKFTNNMLTNSPGLFTSGQKYSHMNTYFIKWDDDVTNFDWVYFEGTLGFDRYSHHGPFGGAGNPSPVDMTTNCRARIPYADFSTAVPHLWSGNYGGLAVYGESSNVTISGGIDGDEKISNNDFASYIGTGLVFYLGDHDVATDGPDLPFAGIIPEFITINTSLDAIDRNKIESYLVTKYGITKTRNDDASSTSSDERDYIASDETVTWDYSSNSSYHNDVAGVGRDDDSELNQKQSKSINSDAIVTIGNTAIATTNEGNGNNFSADKSFLLWGNDNGSFGSYGVSDKPVSINRRLEREWKSQENGTVGTMKIRFDMSSIAGPSGAGTNDLQYVRLLVDADGAFNAGATIISPTTYNNTTDIIEFDHDFIVATGFFFTIGSVDGNQAPLSVDIIDFTVEQHEQEVWIDWTSLNESNSSYYTVERSLDGVHWSKVEKVDASGNGTSEWDYHVVDPDPWVGLSYYRLVQVALSGERRALEPQEVLFKRQLAFEVYPNPAQNVVTLQFTEPQEEVEFSLVDAQGKVIMRQNTTAVQGYCTFSTERVASGVYFLEVRAKGNRYQEKLVISKP